MPSFNESSLDELAQRMAVVAPNNQFSQLHKKMKTSLNETDLEVLFEMKQICNEIEEFFEMMWKDVFTHSEKEVSLY